MTTDNRTTEYKNREAVLTWDKIKIPEFKKKGF